MNYYELLEIQPNASDEVIKMAYKALVKHYHPDVYKGDISYAEKKIKEINLAYDTLSDTEKRAAYDKKIGIMNDDKNAKEVKTTEENIVSKTVRKRTSISIFQRITNGLVDVVVSVGKLIKILIGIVVLYVVIGLFTGNLKEWNEKIIYSSKVVVHFVNNINIPTKYEEGSAEEVIQQYIKALYSGDEYTALHMINAEKEDLKTMTEAISAIFRQYEEDILLGDLLTDMKKSKYVIEKKSDDNQYIVTFTTCDYAAILEQVDTKILNDTYIAKQINEAVKCAPKNYKKETVIYMGKVDEKWCIESVEQEKTFIDALTGNFMGQTYEDALQNTGK